MKDDVIISVDNLGKKYRIRHNAERQRYTALRDVIAEKAGSFLQKLKSLKTEKLKSAAAGPISAFQDVSVSAFKGGVSGTEDFWALQDVSFEVRRGEVVGIIGRNGAGKSTLLKILSRITEPTTGRVHLRGRVASLLEVGTGFHPELTGRENIFLNGAILGMSRAEIRKKFDEIVAFAEVEKFLDTPVKRYSSGMYVRLAFAVAAHLEPEVLIVDEVLAVGDVQFQKKCLGKMQDVSKGGRTVLFVSHNLIAVEILCSSAILLSGGVILERGSPKNLINRFVSTGANIQPEKAWHFNEAPSSAIVKLHRVQALNESHKIQTHFDMNKPILIKAEFWVLQKARLSVSYWLYNQQGVNLFATANYQNPAWANMNYEPGLYSAWCIIPAYSLNEGEHSARVFLIQGTDNVQVQVPDVISFFVNDTGDTRADFEGPWVGAVRPLLSWEGMRLGELNKEA